MAFRILCLFWLAVHSSFAFIATAKAQADRAELENVTITGDLTDVQFIAGRSVTIKANVSDDVFVAGRDVTFDSASVNNAIAAGYDVEHRSGRTADFVAAAANLKISGLVNDDLIAGARSIRISDEGSIGGDVRIAAETMEIEGQIMGSLRAAARRATIAGKISGKVDLLAERIVIAPGAIIAGDLIYRSENKPEIAEGAMIGGEVRQISTEIAELETLGWAILGIGLLIALGWLLAALLLIIILHLVFPRLLSNSAHNLSTYPWSNLGRGVAIAITGFVISGLLMVSIFGIPLGGALLITLGIAWLLGIATTCVRVGLYVRQWWNRPGAVTPLAQIGWAILGATILGIVMLIPVLGWIIVCLAVTAGLGAATAELWQRLRHA